MDRVGAAIQKAREQQAATLSGQELADPPPAAPASIWDALPAFEPDPQAMARSRVVTFDRGDPAHMFFDMLRTKLLRMMRANGWTSVGITSPTSGCGKTTVSLNLAFSFAQLELRTLLVDLDLRRPAIARHLGLDHSWSMAEVLQGRRTAAEGFVRWGERLAFGAGGHSLRASADVLLSSAAGAAVASLRQGFAPDVLLYDLPPMLVSDDVLAFAPQLDCILLIVGAEVTRLDEVEMCVAELDRHATPVHVVVNQCRYGEAAFEYA